MGSAVSGEGGIETRRLDLVLSGSCMPEEKAVLDNFCAPFSEFLVVETAASCFSTDCFVSGRLCLDGTPEARREVFDFRTGCFRESTVEFNDLRDFGQGTLLDSNELVDILDAFEGLAEVERLTLNALFRETEPCGTGFLGGKVSGCTASFVAPWDAIGIRCAFWESFRPPKRVEAKADRRTGTVPSGDKSNDSSGESSDSFINRLMLLFDEYGVDAPAANGAARVEAVDCMMSLESLLTEL